MPLFVFLRLTLEKVFVIIGAFGEVSERFKEPVLKTGDAERHRGFESHPLRQLRKVRFREIYLRLRAIIFREATLWTSKKSYEY